MSVQNTVRALPTLFRIGISEAIAYRAEMFVWILATTMPLVMLALWTAVARDAPIGGYGQDDFVAYFLATFIVRQLTGSWAAWELAMDVRQGTLSMRLLRPVHPLWVYAVQNLSALPLRLVIALPVAVASLIIVGSQHLAAKPMMWLFWILAIVGGWLITLFINLAIGCLSFFLESSLKMVDIYLASYFVMSGYIIPVALFPPAIRGLAAVLPFRYQIGFPVELMTGVYDARMSLALEMLGVQWLFVALLFLVTALVWHFGLKRYNAFGG